MIMANDSCDDSSAPDYVDITQGVCEFIKTYGKMACVVPDKMVLPVAYSLSLLMLSEHHDITAEEADRMAASECVDECAKSAMKAIGDVIDRYVALIRSGKEW